jgi:integrase
MKKRKAARKPVRMTDLWVQNWKQPGLSPSDTESGARLNVGKSGRKESWVKFYRHPISKKLVKRTYPFMGLAQIRKRISDDNYLISQNIDPIEHEREQKRAAVERTEGTLAAVTKRYLDIKAKKLRSFDYYERTLNRHVLPKLGHKQVSELRRSEIVATLDAVETKSGVRAADAALSVLRACLSWYEINSTTFRSPIVKGMMRVKASERARTRALDDDELRAVWNATFDERIGLYGAVVRFLILSGARRSEAAGLRRCEIVAIRDNGAQFTVWKLPPRRSKNKGEVTRPLSAAALDIVNAVPQINDSDIIFTVNGIAPLSMNNMEKKHLLDEVAAVNNWRLHDLRRVHRSLLSRCRVPFEIAERCLGHAQGLLVKTYDRDSHLAAMTEAVERVSAEIERIVAGEKQGKVVRLRS